MQSKAQSVKDYLAELPADRRAAIAAVRKVICDNLDKDYAEGMQYGMIGYYVPHSIYPAGYHCDPKQPLPFAALASQKNYMSLYLMCVYDEGDLGKWFRQAYKQTGKKLDIGKSCLRFKKLDDLALQVIGEAIRRVPAKKFIEYYESVIKEHGLRPSTKKSSAATPKKKQPAAATSKKTAAKSKSARPKRTKAAR